MAKKRDPEVVDRFLKNKGLTKVPKGKEVDHKVPLVDGGSDTVRNLQLLTEKQHAAKTAREATARASDKAPTRHRAEKYNRPPPAGATETAIPER